MDEIGRLEDSALQKTNVEDWPGARALFEEALTHEMPPVRRAWILRSVALTYQRENNLRAAITTAQEAIHLLVSVDDSEDTESLGKWLLRFVQETHEAERQSSLRTYINYRY